MTPPILDCDLVRLAAVLRRAGHHPRPPMPFGPAGVAIQLCPPGQRPAGSVIVTQAPFGGVEWIHASIALEDRMPTYEELKALKDGVFGPDREAYQVFPTEDRHINHHPHALHLWGRADGARVLPDFGALGSI